MRELDYGRIGMRICQAGKAGRRMNLQKSVAPVCRFWGHIERGTRIMSLETFASICGTLETTAEGLPGVFRFSQHGNGCGTGICAARTVLSRNAGYTGLCLKMRWLCVILAPSIEQGNRIIGLTGYQGGRLKELSTVSLHVPVNSMQVTEDIYMIFDHLMMSIFLKTMGSGRPLCGCFIYMGWIIFCIDNILQVEYNLCKRAKHK